MIYNVLAHYYDGLVKDDAATKQWVDLIDAHMQGKELLELACGSGEITIALAKEGYVIDASDLSKMMIEEASKKSGAEKIHFFVMDMREYHVEKKYDGVLCLCDSINYLCRSEDVAELIKNVHASLKEDGVFIFDMHSMDRLEEFKEEFYEEGIVNEHEYTWSIISDDDRLYHNFIFYDENANVNQEQHIQRVYSPELMEEMLKEYFDFEIVTDFDQKGICEGEKYFYICHKKEVFE